MKRSLTLVLAALMLSALLCACSAAGTVDPYTGYSNVSTTRDGRVNGTNGISGTNFDSRDTRTPTGSRTQENHARGGAFGTRTVR